MLAAADWVIYLIPIIAFLVWVLSSALRPAAPPPAVRPKRPQGTEPVVTPEVIAGQQRDKPPVVLPVPGEARPRSNLEEYLLQRRRERARSGGRPRPRVVGTPPVVVVVPEPEPSTAPKPPTGEAVVVMPPMVVPVVSPAIVPRSEKPTAELGRLPSTAEPGFTPPVQTPRRSPTPALLAISRFLERPEDLRAVFLLRELLAPPKGLVWLAHRQR
ncbi:MAG: hypothetical protein NZ914_02470 [Gemmatales bacterium]|nr:hypothetical protein [Gemmatales bacterium]